MGDNKVDYIIVMTIHHTLREMRFINIPIKQIADGMFSNDGLFLIINHHFH